MPGHNALSDLGSDQTGTPYEGGPFLTFGVGPAGSSTPGGKGALYINTAGGASATLYLNIGSAASPTWKAVSNES